ncbi:MAG: biopolymer transporter ExbB [Litoreibacter sp.]|nr:biopolymer transporter ExbB [Litoreibacter sp.]
MDTPDRERVSQFSRPFNQILAMIIILGLVGFGAYLIYPAVAPVFLANPFLNGVILTVFVLGVMACFYQVFQLFTSVSWIDRFAAGVGSDEGRVPRLLNSLAALLSSRGARMQISSASSRSILDSVGTRMDEARDITRYIINLLIFLGLLGTFYGLATTIPGIVETIRSLNIAEGESSQEVFSNLIGGLESQLDGMGTAFASSLLGLAGSLVVGLLELFAGHGQNRFYREMEDWLSTITRVGFSSGEDGGGGGFDQSVVATVLDHMVDQIDSLQGLFMQSETARNESNEQLKQVTAAVATLTQKMEAAIDSREALHRVADGQENLLDYFAQIDRENDGMDPESRMRLRSIDVQMLKLLEELKQGRQNSLDQMSTDLAQVTQAVRQLSANLRPQPSRPLPPKGE